MAKLDKQLTRMYDDGVERAVSVINKDAVKLPGYILNSGDIMYKPGSDVVSINRVGQHLVSIKPYEILIKHGNGYDRNSNTYKFQKTMLGSYHHICHNNKDTILYVCADFQIVKVIKITEDGIEETNLSLFSQGDITNCACIKYGNHYCWWVLTNTTIYYSTDLKSWSTYLLPSSATHAASYSEIKKYEPVFSNSYINDINVINLFFKCCESKYLVKIQTADNGWTPAHVQFRAISAGAYGDDYQAFQLVTNYQNSLSASVSCVANCMTSTNNRLRLRLLRCKSGDWDLNNTYPTGDKIGDKIFDNVFIYDGDQLMMFGPEDSTSSATLGIIRSGTSKCDFYKIKVEANISETTATYLYTLNLKSSNCKMFAAEPPAIMSLNGRDMGDEIYHNLRTFYHDDGNIEFYTKDKTISGLFYTYKKEIVSNHRPIREKVDATNYMKLAQVTTEYSTSYSGNGTTETVSGKTRYTNTHLVDAKVVGENATKILYGVVTDTTNGMQMHIFPQAKVAIVYIIGALPMFISGNDFTVDNNHAIKLSIGNTGVASEGVMNVSGRTYSVRYVCEGAI